MSRLIQKEEQVHKELLEEQEGIVSVLNEQKQEADNQQNRLIETEQIFIAEQKQKNETKNYLKQKDEKGLGLRSKCVELEQEAKKMKNSVQGVQGSEKLIARQIEAVRGQEAKYLLEAKTAHARFYQAIEEIKVKNYVINDLQNKNKNLSKKLQQQ